MLTAVLDRLTSLTSKYFILGAYIPVLVFAFLNGVLLYLEFGWFRAWAGPQLPVTARAFDVVVTLVGLAVVAYVLWSLSSFLQQVLEGQHLRGSWLTRSLRSRQLRRYRALRDGYQTARDAADRTVMEKRGWTDRLRAAAITGNTEHPGHNAYDGEGGPAADALATLRRRRERAERPELDELERAVAALAEVLAVNDIGAEPAALGKARLELLVLLDYAEDEWVAHEAALANRLRARFGGGAVAATAFGNVGESMQSYAISRYRLNLATFWSRLQPLVQQHKEFYTALQDAKLQLDFLVSCVFLSAFTTLLWLAVLLVWTGPGWLVLAVAVLGLLVTWLFYLSATENYVAFGELVRTSIDLYRFDLLAALRVAQPRSLRDERVLWEALAGVSWAGQAGIDLSYQHGNRATVPER